MLARLGLRQFAFSCLAEWRRLYREGALASLALLAAPDALGEATLAELGTAFRRVLRIDVNGSGR